MKSLLIILLSCTLTLASDSLPDENHEHLNLTAWMEKRYEGWLRQHKRSYGSRDEWTLRFGIYQSNVQLIDFINSLDLPYKLADNQFADMTNLEFRSTYLTYKSPGKKTNNTSDNNALRRRNNGPLPRSIDWRKRGAVTPVKNQGDCGSCWAFSAVAAIEGVTKIKTGKLVSLSEQELVDCDVEGENRGCRGGYMENAFKYIIKNKGISSDKDYPYVGKDAKCDKGKSEEKAATIGGYKRVAAGDEKALKAAVARQPVSVAIDASGYAFQLYSSGVFTGYCGKSLDHGVTVVGYGVAERNGRKYWLVKNSWGPTWGESGYVRMRRGARDRDGLCGIAMEASYPTKGS